LLDGITEIILTYCLVGNLGYIFLLYNCHSHAMILT
jgi:hypothetical protein